MCGEDLAVAPLAQGGGCVRDPCSLQGSRGVASGKRVWDDAGVPHRPHHVARWRRGRRGLAGLVGAQRRRLADLPGRTRRLRILRLHALRSAVVLQRPPRRPHRGRRRPDLLLPASGGKDLPDVLEDRPGRRGDQPRVRAARHDRLRAAGRLGGLAREVAAVPDPLLHAHRGARRADGAQSTAVDRCPNGRAQASPGSACKPGSTATEGSEITVPDTITHRSTSCASARRPTPARVRLERALRSDHEGLTTRAPEAVASRPCGSNPRPDASVC